MILWHLGIGAVLVYVSLGRRRIDYRFVLAGAVAPDLLDAAIAAYRGASLRGPAHSLASVLVVAVIVVGAFRGETRLALFGLAVGWLTHLVTDGMWQAPRTFLWPAFGSDFEPVPEEPYSIAVLTAPLEHPWTWLGELAGAALLAWLWVAHGLGHRGRFALFLKDGYLRAWEPK